MSYRKAEEILPRELIEVIQQYVDGENIYIPRKLEHREGASVPRLSQKYYLTEKSIQRIIRQYR